MRPEFCRSTLAYVVRRAKATTGQVKWCRCRERDPFIDVDTVDCRPVPGSIIRLVETGTGLNYAAYLYWIAKRHVYHFCRLVSSLPWLFLHRSVDHRCIAFYMLRGYPRLSAVWKVVDVVAVQIVSATIGRCSCMIAYSSSPFTLFFPVSGWGARVSRRGKVASKAARKRSDHRPFPDS